MNAENLKIAAVQSELVWEDKQANLKMFREKIRACKGADLIILPEMFTTGFSMNTELAETMSGVTAEFMRELSAELNAAIAGSIMVGEEGKFYNRLMFMLPDGRCGTYDKRHLFAHGSEDKHFTPGSKRLIASLKGWRIQVQICYDLRFPVWSRQQISESGEPEFDVLVYVANWPEPRREAWKSLLNARAIENQCYVIGVNRTGKDGSGMNHLGDSAVIDPAGALIATAAAGEEIIHASLSREQIESFREKLPFLKDADRFSIQQ